MFQGDFLKQGTGWNRGHSEIKLKGDDILLSYRSRNVLRGPKQALLQILLTDGAYIQNLSHPRVCCCCLLVSDFSEQKLKPLRSLSCLDTGVSAYFPVWWALNRQRFHEQPGSVGPQALPMVSEDMLDRLLKYGILRPCQSPWNTPLLPVQKPGTEEYRPVQDLRAVNQATVTLHPVVPNPYTLLGLIPAEATHFTCLDLKDAFFCIHLAPQSQPLFAFQWENPENWNKGQLTRTRLPQGFKNSPTTFRNTLGLDLKPFPASQTGCVLLKYVDDLLLAGKSTMTACRVHITSLNAGDQLPQVQGFPLLETASARKKRKMHGDTGALFQEEKCLYLEHSWREDAKLLKLYLQYRTEFTGI